MSRTILLHVGAPKTGSTYFQRRLRVAPESLRAQGVHVPVLPMVSKMAGNAKLLASTLSQAVTPSFRRAFPTLDPRSLDPEAVVSELLNDWNPGAEALVLSAENFRAEHAARMRELLPSDADVRVVLVTRRQDDWVQSYYNQLVKTADTREDFEPFVRRVCGPSKPPLYRPDWEAQVAAWRAAFGDCRLLQFEAAAADLWSAIFEAASLPIPEVPEIPREQVSLDLHQLAFLQSLPEEMPFKAFALHRKAAAEAARRLPIPAKESILQDSDRALLIETFQPGNARLATSGASSAAPLPVKQSSELPVTTLDEVRDRPAFRAFGSLATELANEGMFAAS